MSEVVRIVLVVDSADDAERCRRALNEDGMVAGYECVTTRAELRSALVAFQPDVVLSDFLLPQFDGLRVIAEVRAWNPTVPVIIVTGSLDEETAADCIKSGAADYVLKDRLARLPVAVRGALERRREVEARRITEEELQKVSRAVEQSPTVVVITDREGVIEYVNPRFTELTGYTRSEVIGRKPSLLKAGRTPQAVYEALWDAIKSGREWHGELLNRKKNGELFWERTAISPVRGRDGTITNFVCVKEDVTTWKQRERALRAMPIMGGALELLKTPSECLDTILRVLREEFQAHVTCAFVLGAEGTVVHRTCHGPEGEPHIPRGFPSAELTAAMARDAQPRLASIEGDGAQDAFSVMGYPIVVRGVVTGTIWIGRRIRGEGAWEYSVWDLSLLSELSPIISGAMERTALTEDTERRLRRLVAMKAIDQSIAGSHDQQVTLEILQDHLVRELDVDGSGIMIYHPHLRELELVSSRGLRTGGQDRMALGQPISGVAALERRIVMAGEGLEYPVPSHFAPWFKFVVAVPLIAKGAIVGSLAAFRRIPKAPDAEWLDYLQALADQTAITLENARLFRDLQRSNDELSVAYDATIEGWVRALDLRDQETEGHTQRVTEMSLRLARAFHVPDEELIHLRRGALLHDIGKMAVSDLVLRKPGALTPEERKLMERHTTVAHEILSPIRYLRPALQIPWCHHERWDGTGYPRGLAGEGIPFAARIFAVVDVWDALRSDRVYRPGWPEVKVRAFIRDGAGSQFDPAVVPVFLDLLETTESKVLELRTA